MALVRELTERLATIAAEFGTRLDAVGDRLPDVATGQLGKRDLAIMLLSHRAMRLEHFPGDLFHEPAWDMLLALYVADIDRRSLNVKALAACTPAPTTTAQRWIDHLHRWQLIDRVGDPVDRRRTEIFLSERGARAVDAYLDRIAAAATIGSGAR